MKSAQYTSNIIMVEPIAFDFNSETATNNYFQKPTQNAQEKAQDEFKSMVQKLRSFGINVEVFQDTETPFTPDSIFPNNWVSFHQDGAVVLYPMYAENRRLERRLDILDALKNKGYIIQEIIDLSPAEVQHRFLEGTGSLILDRENRWAYASISERTNLSLVKEFCEIRNYKAVPFHSFQTVQGKRLPIYHTNVMMCIASEYAIICLSAIDDLQERDSVRKTIESSGKEIIEISESQMHQFAGNMLQVARTDGKPYLVMSESAYESLTSLQIKSIESYNPIISVAIPTIETNGGGSARCMMAEVFLPQNI